MTLINVPDTDSFDQWRQKTNSLAEKQGDLDLLNTVTQTDLVSAINEVLTDVDDSGRRSLVLSIAMG